MGYLKKLLIKDTGEIIASDLILADNFFKRLKGLLDRESLEPKQALILDRCQIVHSFFMKFSIDLIFCDKDLKVVALYPNLKPWRISSLHSSAYYVIELAENSLLNYKLKPNDHLELQ